MLTNYAILEDNRYRKQIVKNLIEEPGVSVHLVYENDPLCNLGKLKYKLNYKKVAPHSKYFSDVQDDFELLDRVLIKIQEGCFNLKDQVIKITDTFLCVKTLFKKNPQKLNLILKKYYPSLVSYKCYYFSDSNAKTNYLDDPDIYLKEEEAEEALRQYRLVFTNNEIFNTFGVDVIKQIIKAKLAFCLRDENRKVNAVFMFYPIVESNDLIYLASYKYQNADKYTSLEIMTFDVLRELIKKYKYKEVIDYTADKDLQQIYQNQIIAQTVNKPLMDEDFYFPMEGITHNTPL